MLNQLRSVPSTFMQASRKETSLAVNPPPSIMAWFASISLRLRGSSSGTPSAREQNDVGLPDCAFTPMVGLAPTRAGSHHRYAPGFLRSLLPCMPAQVPNAPGPTMGAPCGGSRPNAA
jgi:hypothetical protein